MTKEAEILECNIVDAIVIRVGDESSRKMFAEAVRKCLPSVAADACRKQNKDKVRAYRVASEKAIECMKALANAAASVGPDGLSLKSKLEFRIEKETGTTIQRYLQINLDSAKRLEEYVQSSKRGKPNGAAITVARAIADLYKSFFQKIPSHSKSNSPFDRVCLEINDYFKQKNYNIEIGHKTRSTIVENLRQGDPKKWPSQNVLINRNLS